MGLQITNVKYISIRPVWIDVEDKLMTFIKVDLSDFYIWLIFKNSKMFQKTTLIFIIKAAEF